MNTLKNYFQKRLHSKGFYIFLMSLIFIQGVFPKGIKIMNGSESSLKLSKYITEYPPTRIDFLGSQTGSFSVNTVPRILVSGDRDPILFFFNGRNLYSFDYSLQKISGIFPNPVGGLWKIFPSRSEGIVYLSGNEFSKFNLNSGKSEWSRRFGLTGVLYTSAYYGYKFPVIFHEQEDQNLISVVGLQRPSSEFKYLNRLMMVNSMTGELLSNRAFHFRRKLSESQEIFVNLDQLSYEVIDINSLNTIIKGRLKPGDLLKPSEYLAVERNRIGLGINYLLSEFTTHLLEKGFIITSTENGDLWGGVKASKWVIFNENGSQVKTIFPAPLTSINYKVANRGAKKWPVYMLHTLQKKLRRTRVDKIIALQKDGSFSEIEMPVIEGIKEYLLAPVASWFHIGDQFYYLKYKSLFNFRIGEKTGRLLYKFGKSEKCDVLSAWDRNYLMLTSSVENQHLNAVILRAADGVKMLPENYMESADTLLWKMAVDHNQSGLPLPKNQITPAFKKYSKYGCTRDFSIKQKIANKSKIWKGVRMFKVWGDYRSDGKYGDIGIVTAKMKDKSSALIGISIADNRTLFSVPVMKFSGLYHRDYNNIFPEGDYLPFNIIRLNDSEALLVVLEKINLLKIYMLKRP